MPRVPGDLSVGDGTVGFGMHIPEYDPGDCGGEAYLPVGIEVRIASRDEVDFNQSCAPLLRVEVRRLLPRLLVDSRLGRRKPERTSAHQGRDADGRLRDAGRTPTSGSYTGLQLVGARTCNYGAGVNATSATAIRAGELQGAGNGVDAPQRARGRPYRYVDDIWRPLQATTAQQRDVSRETGKTRPGVKRGRATKGARSRNPSGTAPARSSSRPSSVRHDTAGAIDLVRTSGPASVPSRAPQPTARQRHDGSNGRHRLFQPWASVRRCDPAR